ncbi:MAG TPA: DUF481 domain-containing protein [Candidatus Paceibacterota bacterium]|nr:DUF481 domain-containing protein [Candidatus Paceibacterota bacterium]
MKSITSTTTIAALLIGAGQSFAADAAADKPQTWETSASAGLTVTRGNNDSMSANLGFRTETKWDKNEFKAGADGIYGKSKPNGGDETVSAETLSAFGQYNRLFTEQFYGLGRVEGLHDNVNGVKYRLTVSPGAGYYFIKDAKTTLNAEVGPGFIHEKLKKNPGYEENDYITIRLAENFKHSLNDSVRVWQKAEFLPQVDDFENYILNFEVGMEADLSKKLSFQTKILDTYDNVPAPGLKRNDLKWINAISYKF